MKSSEEYKNIIMFVQGGISLVRLNAIIYILWSVGYRDMNGLLWMNWLMWLFYMKCLK